MPAHRPDDVDSLIWDHQHLWHPYASMTDPSVTRWVSGAEGVRITIDGQSCVDAMSSWWSAIHGYRHPVLDEAARTQIEQMSHVMFGGLTHEPAVRLGRQLVDLTPEGLEHVFFADSGSVSVEVAMKLALQAQRGLSRPARQRFLTVRGGYHGDTFDAMSVCDPEGGMHSMFAGVLPRQVFAQQPPTMGESIETWERTFRRLAERYSDSLAAIIVEPLLQGAGGMHPYPADCLTVMREVADEHDLILIFDEIATGFGRTGTMFAADSVGVSPDIMCVGKALTGGYLTLAATLCTVQVAEAVSASESSALMHGPTFMANPLACAIASANVELLCSYDWQAEVARISSRLGVGLGELFGTEGVHDVRTLGAVSVVQLDHPVDVEAATAAALKQGVWLRPFRDLVYTMPPYLCSDDDVDTIVRGITAAVRAG